jgi:hypothetical protein
VLPSRSALSDLGLIADIFEKNAPKLVLFLPKKSSFCPKKSDFHFFSFPHKATNNLKLFFPKYGIFSSKSLMSELSFWKKSDFDPKIAS